MNEKVAQKYELVPGTPLKGFFAGFGELDFTTMSLAKAERLVKDGFTKLKPKESKPAGKSEQK